MPAGLHFAASHSDEDSASFALADSNDAWRERERQTGKFVCVSVSEEQAVDSYNSMFTCSFHMSEAQAIELRDWLTANFPKE